MKLINVEILLTILLIAILIFFYIQERKGHTEMLNVLKQIRDKIK